MVSYEVVACKQVLSTQLKVALLSGFFEPIDILRLIQALLLPTLGSQADGVNVQLRMLKCMHSSNFEFTHYRDLSLS